MVYEGIYLYILVYTQIFRVRDNICKDMMYIEVYTTIYKDEQCIS